MLIFSRYSWWVGAMVGFALLLTAASQVGALNPMQGVFLTVTAPFENLLTSIFRPVAGFLGDAGNINDIRDENRQLRLENEELRNQATALQLDSERLKELEAALKISQGATSQQFVAANIVHRDATPFVDVVSIDRGTNDGLKAGMVVVSSQNTLMGTVTDVFKDRAFVRLITDSRSKVAAEVLDTKSEGIIRGSANRTLTFEFAQPDIKVGDVIVTSALTGRYPAGLRIGAVTDVAGTPQDVTRRVTVEPGVRLGTATTVLVMTTFVPQNLGPAQP
ncbi:MAG: rod shape-determining protein MreC [Chloroflexi bacterium]|nr:rod shape-determining protein MreC [Chloroflexota bacterium]